MRGRAFRSLSASWRQRAMTHGRSPSTSAWLGTPERRCLTLCRTARRPCSSVAPPRSNANWDGTYATTVSASDQAPSGMLEFTFSRCHAVKLGGPNDEALNGHPLYNKGLQVYAPHVIHNSDWIRDEEAINSVHPMHEAGWHERLNHYFFVFHDEMFEALAQSVSVRSVQATMAECLASAVQTVTEH